MAKIRFEKTIVSARGLLFFLFTNRYAAHLLLFIIAVTTISSQLVTQPASAQDAGERSLLYTLISRGQDDTIEEFIQSGTVLADVNYLGATTIQTIPGIDYDYDTLADSPADLGIVGTLAEQPRSEFPVAVAEPVTTDTPSTAPVQRQGIESYTVRAGDTVASIAQNFNISIGTVLWTNNLSKAAAIKPGDTLRILPTSGILHTVKRGETLAGIAQTYRVNTGNLLEANDLATTARISAGQELLVPDATPLVASTRVAVTPRPATNPRIVAVKPDVPISRIKNKALDIYQELATTDGNDDRNKPAPAAASTRSKLLWPTHLRVINQYYGYSHTGLDIDGDYTDPLYASDDGVVEKAGWNNGGYGLMIFIDHGNGFKTRYGHASKLFVKAGDRVTRGEVIGMVGTTGRSTGTHLHYEVYVNGKRANPLTYIR